ncbi:helix-turn-helix domain-containing protein [Chitiniphilus eburneus]|uniref:helix-turn-helix domain-containing protein n=1 Tax=Chitiniphilus eburneus TaxID=2571148 RepID=UPI0035CFFB44
MQKNSSDCNEGSENFLEIGFRLREERTRLGFSQADLTALLGVTSRTLSEYEKGNNFPKADYLSKFEAMGADVLYVLTGRRAMGVVTDDEAIFLNALRAAPPAMRAAALAVLQSGQGSGVYIAGEVGNQMSGGVNTIHTLNVGGSRK